MRLRLWRVLAERRDLNALIPPAPFSHLDELKWGEGGVRSMRFLQQQGKFFNTETLYLFHASKWERVASRPGEGTLSFTSEKVYGIYKKSFCKIFKEGTDSGGSNSMGATS